MFTGFAVAGLVCAFVAFITYHGWKQARFACSTLDEYVRLENVMKKNVRAFSVASACCFLVAILVAFFTR